MLLLLPQVFRRFRQSEKNRCIIYKTHVPGPLTYNFSYKTLQFSTKRKELRSNIATENHAVQLNERKPMRRISLIEQ